MDQDILLSKIVPNATDFTWTQAYTTVNVYITLSIEKEESKTPVTPYGKSLLEKLQREFFALDEKSLDNIKKAVSNVVETIEDGYKYSIIVGALSGDVLYIVIASYGQVVIKRGEKLGVVATGIEGELHGFSGKLQHDDIVFLQTGDFSKKFTTDQLSEKSGSNDVLLIAEELTPLVHGDSKGTEGAIILQFKDHSAKPQEEVLMPPQDLDDTDNEEGIEESVPEKENDDEVYKENLWTKPPKDDSSNVDEIPRDEMYDEERKKSRFSIPKINLNKRTIIIASIILLVLILVGSIFFQTSKSNEAKNEAQFATVYDPIKSKYDEAVTLSATNQTLALEEFNQVLELINQALPNYDEGSEEYKKLTELKTQTESQISELEGGGSAKNVKEYLKAGDELQSIRYITAKGGTLIVLDSKGEKVATINDDGTIDETYDIEMQADFISSDDKYIYAMGTAAKSVDRGNGSVKELTDEIEGNSFDIFGSNLYTLNNDDILKYVSPNYDGVSYFTDKPTFSSKPADLSISGPIFVLESNGTVSSFTKGVKDEFSISGLKGPIGEGGKIYADPDLENIYVMDVRNQRVVVLNEEGAYVTQYEGSFIKGAISCAFDEENEIGYVLNSDKVYSFDL